MMSMKLHLYDESIAVAKVSIDLPLQKEPGAFLNIVYEPNSL